MSRTTKSRRGHLYSRTKVRWDKDGKPVVIRKTQGRGRHGYRNNKGKTAGKREGNKWERQEVKQQLKKEPSRDEEMRLKVEMDKLLDRGLTERAEKLLREKSSPLPKTKHERVNARQWLW